MKHTKFSKLLSVVLTVAVVMLSSVSAFAGATITAEQDVASTEVNITYTGTAEGINLAGLTLTVIGPATEDGEGNLVFDETKDIIAGAQVFVDENGNYTGKIVLSNEVDADNNSVVKTGYYKVIAASKDEVVGSVFYFARPGERKDALKTILGATDDATIVNTIDDSIESLGINAEMWELLKDNADAKKDAASAIRSNEELKKINKDDIKDEDVKKAAEQINKEILVAMLNANKGLVKDLNDYKNVIDNKEALDLYNALGDDAKKAMIALISGKDYENFAAMNKELADMAKLAYINTPGATVEKVSEYAHDLGLEYADEFDNLASNKLKSEAVTATADAKAKTIAELDAAFEKAVKSKQGSSTSGSTSGTTGGTTGGSSGSTITTTPSKPAAGYIDLAGYDWAKSSIENLTKLEVLTGYGDGLFGPAYNIKREEFAKVIVAAMYGKEADKANVSPVFTDAQNAWYSSYVGYGAQIGIISGFDATTFGVGQNISRQDIMAILYRVMLNKGYSANTTPIEFADSADIYDYAKEAVYALANAGVVSGYNGSINPQGAATRAEVAVMVNNFIQLFK